MLKGIWQAALTSMFWNILFWSWLEHSEADCQMNVHQMAADASRGLWVRAGWEVGTQQQCYFWNLAEQLGLVQRLTIRNRVLLIRVLLKLWNLLRLPCKPGKWNIYYTFSDEMRFRVVSDTNPARETRQTSAVRVYMIPKLMIWGELGLVMQLVIRYVPISTLDFLENVDWLTILGFLVHV